MRTTLSLILSFYLISLFSQSDLRIGQWRSYLPYHIGFHVTQSNDQVFYATPFSLMIIDKADNAIQLLSKVEALGLFLGFNPMNNSFT